MNEPWHLFDGYFDGELTPPEERQLREWLENDSEHLRLFVCEAHLHHHLRREALASQSLVDCAPAVGEIPLAHSAVTPEKNAARTDEAPLIAFPKSNPSRSIWRPRPMLALAASIVFLLGISVWLFPRTNDEATLALAPTATVLIERGTETFAVRDNMKLRPGDVLRTGTNSVATITFAPEITRLEIQPGGELNIASGSRGKSLDLRTGTLVATVARQRPFHPMIVTAPGAEARVLGTHFTLTATTNRTRLDVAEGRVRLRRMSDGWAVKVGARDYAVVADGTELKAQPQTSGLLREIWTGIPGGEVNDLLDHPDYPNRPARRDLLKTFETPVIQTNNYACRLIGYIHPPVTGDYTFWIASGGYGALWLSPDENPMGKVRIAAAVGGLPRQWAPPKPTGKLQMPQSPKIRLVAGLRYFIQAVEKTATNSSHLEVAWQIPGAEREIISGEFLSPFPVKDK